MDFEIFRDGIGGRFVRETFGLDISACRHWDDYTNAMLRHRYTLGGEEKFVGIATERFCSASTGEAALLLASIFAADYRWLADELVAQKGRPFFRMIESTGPDFRLSVVACLLRK